MSSNTTNYNLIKPDEEEFYDVEIYNANVDTIDAQLKANETAQTEAIQSSLGTAADQVLVSSGVGAWASKTLAQFKAWLGLGSAAYTASTAYATAAQGAEADSTATTVVTHLIASDPHPQYALDTDLGNLAGAGRTTETVKGLADAAAIHQAEIASQAAGKGASMIGVQDAGAHFTGTNIETVLTELFTFANSGKTAIANAINAKGIAASSADIFSLLAAKIGTASLVNTADANAIASQILAGLYAYVNGVKITGTMPVQNGDGNGYTNMNSKIGNAWPSGTGRLHFPIIKGAYLTSPADTGFMSQDTPMGYLDNTDYIAANILSGKSIFGLTGTASPIKSIQRGITTLTNNPTNITISPVDNNKSIVRVSYRSQGSSYVSNLLVKAQFTSQTGIELRVGHWGGNTAEIEWEVIEFQNIKSFQYGSTYHNTDDPATVGISAINAAKSMLFFSHFTEADYTSLNNIPIYGRILNSTSLQFRGYSTTDFTVAWYVVEFN